MALHECPTCSAMVRNPDLHNAWHAQTGQHTPDSLEGTARAQQARFAATAELLASEPSPDPVLNLIALAETRAALHEGKAV